jgi:hypothetical protein
MIPYILQVTVVLTVCFLFYKLFLQKATFYGLNRWTLLGCLVLSFVLPLLPAPRGWTFLKDGDDTSARLAARNTLVRQEAVLPSSAETVHEKIPMETTRSEDFSPVGEEVTLPASVAASPIKTPPHAAMRSAAATPPPAHILSSFLLQGLKLLSYAYVFGLLLFGAKFILQIAVLCYRAKSCYVIRDGCCRIIETTGDRGPCTFGNTIFINPSLYDPATYQQILVHEKIHVRGGHTLDILLAELAVVFQWFNPFVWLYRREVENNLEFLTDRSVLEHADIERSAYQLSLLRVTAPYMPFSITNNYNHSLLKRRIVMMNIQHSTRRAIWKYVALFPIFILLVCLLNKPAALGQSAPAKADQQQPAVANMQSTGPSQGKVAASAPDTTISPAKATARVAANATAIAPTTSTIIGTTAATTISDDASNVSINPAVAEATTSVTFNGTIAAASMDTSLPHLSDYIDLRQGSWFLTVDSDNMNFLLRAQSGDNSWESSMTIKKSEINPYPGQGTVEFKLVREPGTITFKGQFDGEQGYGHFQFRPDEGYFIELGKLGVEDIEDSRKQSFFMINISKDFVRMLNRNGYTPIEQREVFALANRKVDEPFLKYWKSSGVEGADQIHNLFMLKMQHIDRDYVEDLRKAGYTHLTVQQLIKLKRLHVDGNYVRSMSSGSATPVSPEELATYKMMQIDPEYLASLKKIGYEHLDRLEIRSLYNAHVTADYIKGFQDAGFSNVPPRTLAMLKYQNITPDLAKTFRTLGYSDIDLNRLSYLQRAGITADFINGFHKIGYDNIPVNLLYMLKSAGVDAAYVEKMKEKGFNSTDLNKYIRLKRDFN